MRAVRSGLRNISDAKAGTSGVELGPEATEVVVGEPGRRKFDPVALLRKATRGYRLRIIVTGAFAGFVGAQFLPVAATLVSVLVPLGLDTRTAELIVAALMIVGGIEITWLFWPFVEKLKSRRKIG